MQVLARRSVLFSVVIVLGVLFALDLAPNAPFDSAVSSLEAYPGGVATAQVSGPSEVGEWEGPFSTPVVGRHVVVLPPSAPGAPSKVLIWTTGSNATLWNNPMENPADWSFTSVPAIDEVFCSGHCSLGDGKVLVFGGSFNPAAPT